MDERPVEPAPPGGAGPAGGTPAGGSDDPGERRFGPPWLMPVIGGAVALVVLLGLVVWAAGGDDDAEPPPTSPAPVTSAGDTTTSEPATTGSTTSSPATTTAPTTAATVAPSPTTAVPPSPTIAVTPGDPSFVVTSPYFDTPFTMELAASEDDLTVYDGEIDAGASGVRCVAVFRTGIDDWAEWCAEAGRPARFVVIDGIDPWLVELGAVHGEVTLARYDPTWSLPTNGCSAPLTTLIATADVEPAVMTGLVCVGREAFLRHSSVLLGNGPPDGGGLLLTEGDEGWNSAGGGTSLDCRDPVGDGVDRCAAFGVDGELFEAVLPIPPTPVLPGVPEIVGVRDDTVAIRDLVGDARGPDEVAAIMVAELSDREAPATVRQALALDGGRVDLLVVEVPALDDSVRSTTWAVWLGAGDDPGRVVRATAWETCGRGLAGPDTCI